MISIDWAVSFLFLQEKVWAALMAALSDYHVFIEGIVLKTNMVVPGTKSCKKATPEEIGNATVSLLSDSRLNHLLFRLRNFRSALCLELSPLRFQELDFYRVDRKKKRRQ